MKSPTKSGDLSIRDQHDLARAAATPIGPEMIHPDCRELQVIWRKGEVFIWLFNDAGRRFASFRAGSPKGLLMLSGLAGMSSEQLGPLWRARRTEA